ncbi:hypothetical protein [Dictyobacter aurantiacus]|uniref:Uncharacterized protein n=1 Tax=Dictyobacter aurantiacus TaxID=1936993 RepID=A0A401ZRN8_9CHLR|nr:hypothetical protein [Dictyobacter aurantiacus]GCE09547.1 hypothetical protein KDAU_68760 [Dictyobacter aurantiacus]
MQAANIVQEARNSLSGLPSSQVLHALTYLKEGAPKNEDGSDPHATLRAQVLKELQNTLSLKDRPLLRFLMEQEITCRKNDIETESDNIHLSGFLLFLLGQLEDVELLWKAKRASFDTWCGFDIQFLVGAGVSTTLIYLHSIEQEWAKKARTYIEECQQTGDLDDLERYRRAMQRYFEIEPSAEEANTTEHPETQ